MDVTINDLKEILANTSFGNNAKLLDGNDSLREEGVDSLDLLDFYLTLNDYQKYVSDKLNEAK
jgi:acyl carrier protein